MPGRRHGFRASIAVALSARGEDLAERGFRKGAWQPSSWGRNSGRNLFFLSGLADQVERARLVGPVFPRLMWETETRCAPKGLNAGLRRDSSAGPSCGSFSGAAIPEQSIENAKEIREADENFGRSSMPGESGFWGRNSENCAEISERCDGVGRIRVLPGSLPGPAGRCASASERRELSSTYSRFIDRIRSLRNASFDFNDLAPSRGAAAPVREAAIPSGGVGIPCRGAAVPAPAEFIHTRSVDVRRSPARFVGLRFPIA